MSSISSIGGFGVESGQFDARAFGKAGGIARVGQGGMPNQGGDRNSAMMERIESLATEAGLDSETIAALQEELQSAISTALTGIVGTGDSRDPRQDVRSAVQSVLEKYGINSEDFMPKRGGQTVMMAQIESLATEAGLDSDTTATLLEELQSAISTALAEANDEDESGDPRQAVQAVIQSTLEKYGIDADQLKPPTGGPGFGGGGPPATRAGNLDTGSKGQDLFAGLSKDANQGVLQSLLDLLQLVEEEV